MCVAPDYVLVHRSVKDQLTEELKKTILQFFSSDASANDEYCKIINERQFLRLIAYLKDGSVIFGGKYDASKLFIGPTLMEDVLLDSQIMKDEIFGPILPIIPFDNFEEAKSIIAQNPNPLAFYVYTSSSQKEKQWLQGIPAGGGCVNNSSWHLTNHHLPFGGRGTSGFGEYHGKNSFETFSHRKAILKTPTWFDPRIKYPPFKGKLGLFKKIVR
jgi:aldehyde dehydrogenase (NAD+)